MGYIIKITTESELELVECADENTHYSFLAKQIGCEWVEHVPASRLILSSNIRSKYKEKACMIVDEEGALDENRKLNSLATALYSSGYGIFGNVLIMGEATKDGIKELCLLSKEHALELMIVFQSVIE